VRIGAAIAGCDRDVALLGVTPELAGLGARMTAFDLSAQVIAAVWPGDDNRRRAVVADWLRLPIESGGVDAVIGDGSLNAVAESLPELLAEIGRILSPQGRAVFRTFCSPETPETPAEVRRATEGAVANFHAYKFRIAMTLAADYPRWTVPAPAIRDAFNAMFPDRAALSRAAGSSREEIDTIDSYATATHPQNDLSASEPPVRNGLPSLRRTIRFRQRALSDVRAMSNGRVLKYRIGLVATLDLSTSAFEARSEWKNTPSARAASPAPQARSARRAAGRRARGRAFRAVPECKPALDRLLGSPGQNSISSTRLDRQAEVRPDRLKSRINRHAPS
jgi:SAM-dependent methyltransferase